MKFLEITLWVVGAMLMLAFSSVVSWQEIERRGEVAAFVDVQRNMASAIPRVELPAQSLQLPPRELDSLPPTEVAAPEPARATLNTPGNVPIAILRIPAIGMVVPVNTGTGTKVLLRGAGLVEGSALPGSSGNVAIAAHRDSYFRSLKDLSVSDMIELDTLKHSQLYRVTDLKVVEPTDVKVLADVGGPVITLITCYPFYFIGHAPKRFIVRAVATDFRK